MHSALTITSTPVVCWLLLKLGFTDMKGRNVRMTSCNSSTGLQGSGGNMNLGISCGLPLPAAAGRSSMLRSVTLLILSAEPDKTEGCSQPVLNCCVGGQALLRHVHPHLQHPHRLLQVNCTSMYPCQALISNQARSS